jgi:predicted MFS family arabinose efflux permease
MLLGSLTANRLAKRFGHGPVLWVIGLAATPFGLLVPLIAAGPWLWVAMCSWLVLTYRIGMNNVILVSLRQRATPDRLLSRMNATMRFLMTGVLAVGAALAGTIGQYAGIRAALWVAAVGLAFAWVPLVFTPLRQMRGNRSSPSHGSALPRLWSRHGDGRRRTGARPDTAPQQ